MYRYIPQLALLLVLAPAMLPAAAQQPSGDATADEAAADILPGEEIIDEVTVLGIRELADLRAEVIAAEDVVFDLFNDLNDDDRYDIICKKETRIGSQIPKRICQARLFRDAVAAQAEEVVEGEILPGVKVNAAKHNEILRKKMAALANEHPELLTALKERLETSRKFQRERAKRFD